MPEAKGTTVIYRQLTPAEREQRNEVHERLFQAFLRAWSEIPNVDKSLIVNTATGLESVDTATRTKTVGYGLLYTPEFLDDPAR